ncbi:MAG: arsenate reductase ArsC [Pseudomonadota bacterium]
MASGTYNVLFLCQGNSARSIIAEAIMNKNGHDHFHAYSAGAHPRGNLHPYTVDLLNNLGEDPSRYSSKPMEIYSEQSDIRFDFIFTVCDQTAAEGCPVFPGSPMTAHWGVPDPASVTGTEAEIRLAFADTWRMMQNRISIFTSLPFASLDRLSLQHKLDEIGKTTLSDTQETA